MDAVGTDHEVESSKAFLAGEGLDLRALPDELTHLRCQRAQSKPGDGRANDQGPHAQDLPRPARTPNRPIFRRE
jgi:hypothetical protein